MPTPLSRALHLFPLLVIAACSNLAPLRCGAATSEDALARALARAGTNRPALETALDGVSEGARPHLEWLIAGMNDRDLTTLDAAFLIEHADLALEAWQEAPWRETIPLEVFRESILPYASVDERRDRWRADFRARFAGLVADAKTPGEAATQLNRSIFPLLGVKYSTKRPKANQSPYESIEAGLASCTGLSILLVDACRAVGVPARFVGTPLWSDGSGNHSWVEVWDGERWRFTGAAEPAGDALDEAWFAGRASKAHRKNPQHAIYATTWRRTPHHFPMVWSPEDRSVSAVDVTDRYTEKATPLPPGTVRVRFKVVDATTGERVSVPFRVRDGAVSLFEGQTRDEGFDANDHTPAALPRDRELSWEVLGARALPPEPFTATEAETLLTRTLPAKKTPTEAIRELRSSLESSPLDRAIGERPWSQVPLDAQAAEEARALLIADRFERLRHARRREVEDEVITLDGHELQYATRTFGRRPARGWSLWISLHGGGGTTAATNDQQWENQKKLYSLEEGIYLAPRAPTNTWNLWHQPHIDALFDRLIENCIAAEGVDPDRVFILGYSAGGDGVYQLAPRMADRFAGAAVMAGHPNDARPEGLRNLPFTLHMGGEDAAYRRNAVAREWQGKLAKLRKDDPDGYPHWVEIHEGKGHWMDGDDAAALPWLAGNARDLRPRKIVWVQDDVTHERFYWLRVANPKRGDRIEVALVEPALLEPTAHSDSDAPQTIEVTASRALSLTLRLDDSMVDLDRVVVVRCGGRELWRGLVPRTIASVARTLEERGDPRGVFSAEITVEVPGPSGTR